jgi:hypothetical protein
MVTPVPAVSLSCLLARDALMVFTVFYRVAIFPELVPTTFNVVANTLSRVVMPKEESPGIVEVLTTTASAKVMGTNSVLD